MPPALVASSPPPHKPVMAFRDVINDIEHDRESR
jgi:hypothetical protein